MGHIKYGSFCFLGIKVDIRRMLIKQYNFVIIKKYTLLVDISICYKEKDDGKY